MSEISCLTGDGHHHPDALTKLQISVARSDELALEARRHHEYNPEAADLNKDSRFVVSIVRTRPETCVSRTILK